MTNPFASPDFPVVDPQEEISRAIAGRRCSLVLTPNQDQLMVELITKMLK